MRRYIATAAVIALLVAIPYFIALAVKRKRLTFPRFANYLLVAYGVCLVFYTILFTGLGSGGGGINLQLYIPFVTDASGDSAEMLRWFSIDEYIYNIVLFLPFGVLVPLNFPRVDRVYKTVALALCCTLAIELVQRLIGRAFDVNDIAANTLGGLIGACAFFPVRWFIRLLRGGRVRKKKRSADC